MNEEFLRFKIFPDRLTAEEFAEVLKQNGIDYLVEEDALVFDPSYANNPLNKDYAITVKQIDFTRASRAYEEYFAKQIDNVPEDYYLLSFTDDELLEILTKPDEWGPFDYQLAQKLLKEKGIEITKEKTDSLKAERYKELAKQEDEPAKNIAAYYIISILFFPVGLVIGWVWGYSKKQLPDGYKVYAYNDRVRNHGRTIFMLSAIILVITVSFKIVGLE